MRSIPTVTRYLLIINILVFVAAVAMGTDAVGNYRLNDILGLHFFMAPDFHVWQLITYMFAHGGFMHIFMNMFMLWMFGMVVENVWGPKKFLFYYIVCGIGAGLCQEGAQWVQYMVENLDQADNIRLIGEAGYSIIPVSQYINMWTTVGASGAIYAVLLAFGLLFPNERMFIIPIPIPIKAKWIVIGSVALELFFAFQNSGDGVAHLAHLGGMLFGFILFKYWQKHPYASTDFGMSKGEEFFNRMHSNWENRKSSRSGQKQADDDPTAHETDWDYNARKQREQEEVDRILDKIRRSGYDSLTKEEKQRLFDMSKRK